MITSAMVERTEAIDLEWRTAGKYYVGLGKSVVCKVGYIALPLGHPDIRKDEDYNILDWLIL